MNRERLIGLAVVLLVVGGALVWRNRGRERLEEGETSGLATEEQASELAKQMGVLLPEDVEKAELASVSETGGRGLATRKFVEATFTHSVLAALPEPQPGTWYEAWLVREDPFDLVYTGKLKLAKGGWVLDFVSGEDLRDHSQVVVTLEEVDDQKPETHILEGTF